MSQRQLPDSNELVGMYEVVGVHGRYLDLKGFDFEEDLWGIRINDKIDAPIRLGTVYMMGIVLGSKGLMIAWAYPYEEVEWVGEPNEESLH